MLLALWMSSLDKHHCINHVFYFLYFYVDPGGTACLGTSRRQYTTCPGSVLFKCSRPNRPVQTQTHPQPPLLSVSPYSGSHTKLALITPGPGIKQLEAAPMHQSSLKLLRIANSKPVYPASLFLPEEDTVKAFIHSPLLTLPPERPPTASPHASCHGTFSLSFATLSSKQSFQWQSSPELWTLPYLSNKIY